MKMYKILPLLLLVFFIGCGSPDNAPMFGIGDTVFVSDVVDSELEEDRLGIVIGFKGNDIYLHWSYKILYSNSRSAWIEEKYLTLKERFNWYDTRPHSVESE